MQTQGSVLGTTTGERKKKGNVYEMYDRVRYDERSNV